MYNLRDIKPGMTLVLRNGTRRIVREDGVLTCDPTCGAKYAAGPALYLDEYCSRLLHPNPALDIVAVWDPEAGPLWQREEGRG